MIFSLTIILIAAIYAAVKISSGIKQVDDAPRNDNEAKSAGRSNIRLGIIVGVLGLVVGAAQPFSIEKVDSGYAGIIVNLVGDKRGVQGYQYRTGWVVYNSWFKQVLEFPTYQQHIEYPEQQVITKGGFSATIKPTFNYSLKEKRIGDMFSNLRKPIDEVEQGWLQTAIVGAVNDVSNKWKVDDIFNQREQFESAIMAEANKRISQWFTISQLRTNIVPPKSLQAAIESETRAIKEAQAKEQQALVAIANGKKLVAQAQADSAQRVITAAGKAQAVLIEAKAEAEAIKIKQREINAAYNDYIRANKWDGKLPSTILGSNANTLFNIK
jgi:regulator of protease activity HflC (stomatin/prohibitin superfamily)